MRKTGPESLLLCIEMLGHGNRQEIETRSERHTNMMRETFLVLLLIASVAKAKYCDPTCGSIKHHGKTVPYPFGFSDGCGIRLNCNSRSNEIMISNFTVQNITSNSIFLNLPAKCDRPVESIAHLFGPNFAPTWNNDLLVQDCTNPQNGCLIPDEVVKKQSNLESCGAINDSISCFSQKKNGSEIMSSDYLNRTRCKYWFGSIAFYWAQDSQLSLEFETIELGWWVSGSCDCADNATCTTPKLGLGKPPGFRCQCDEGLYGDGFRNGSGCLRRSPGPPVFVVVLLSLLVFFDMIMICHQKGALGVVRRICNRKRILGVVRRIRNQKGSSSDNLSFQTLRMDKFLNDMEREKPIRFTSQQLRIATNNFTNLLGSGGFGAVYKGIIDDPNGTLVAVKVLSGTSDKRIDEQFMAEVSTLGRIHHFNLVRLYGFCFERQLRALVYEYMSNGSLDKFLFNGNKMVGFKKLHDIAVGTARGIAYLHEECQQRIVHYDIKPENILLDENFFPKVADFGLAKLCNRDNSYITMTGGRGTPGYAAPEVWMRLPITYKCDVYSFGMLLFEIIGRRRNLDLNLPESQDWFPRWGWNKFEAGELGELMLVCGIKEKDREAAERMVKVAMWCVQYRPELRPSMSVVVKMLEGEVEIPRPSINPFQHLMPGTPIMVAYSTSALDTDSYQTKTGYSDVRATPIMTTYEIEIASTS